MKLLAWMLILVISYNVCAQTSDSTEILSAAKNSKFEKAYVNFSQGKYQATIDELTILENSKTHSKSVQGLITYWKAIAYNRTQDFPQAIIHFDRALNLGFAPQDIYYEYGQALFADEKLKDARLQFRESLKKKFKRAVSLYYIAFISRELGEKKKAVTFFKAINKLDESEAKEVRQSAQTQIADIYLEQVEKQPDAFRTIDSFVIPQYKKALELDPESGLAPTIQEKIVTLQRKYDLVLFKLRNGRPTLVPPYFLRLAQEIGNDSNVTFSPTETTVSKSRQSSIFSKTDMIGRYTFYYRNIMSVAPEIRFNNTYYFNRVPEIYRNDNYLIAPALRTAYEHHLWKKPASHLFDYDYSEARRDVNAEKNLEFSSRAHTLMLGERFNYFDSGETIVRIRHRMFESYQSTQDSKTTSLVFEQIKSLKTNTLLFYASYDRTRVDNNVFDTDAFTFRTDLIMARVKDWFTPSIGLGITTTDPINDRDNRGREFLINPNARLSKTFARKWRGNLKFDYQNNKSKDEDAFAFKKNIYSLELEYLF